MRPDTIGPYEVQRELGRGGMGEVYLALDPRLDRQVAVKALPEHLGSDADKLARFQREAKVLASLSHPNIGAIYGLEEADGHKYLILEFIEGETLADRLANGPVPVDEALNIAKQIAEALEAAHDKGIVHRDLKPGNIMVTSQGVIKVLDFGLARTADGSPSSTNAAPPGHVVPTVQSPTVPGVILGTAGYMSPEQARGKPVDKRSDIFSFGCVLYEMLTGVQPFSGETVSDAIGATLHKETDFGVLPAGTPPTIRLLLSRCLAKNRADRLHDIGDARLEIVHALSDPRGTSLGLGGVAARMERRGVRAALPWLVGGAIAVFGGTFPLWSGRLGLGAGGRDTASAPKQVVRFTIEPPTGYTLPAFTSSGSNIAISPVGDRIVFVAEADNKPYLCVRDVADGTSRVLPNTEGCFNPFFSPDGKWLAFVSKDRLLKMPAGGGPALAICDVANFASFAWLDDGTIVWGASTSGVWRVSANDGVAGKPVQLAKAGPETKAPDGGNPALGFDVPVGVPGADYILCCSWDGPTTESFNVLAVSLKDGLVRTVLRTATEPRLIARDRLLFMRGTTVMTIGFDPVRGVVVGEPTVALEGVRTDQWQDSAYIGVSRSGAFAYVPGGRFGSGKRLVRVDETGKVSPLLETADNYNMSPVISPDGRNAVVTTLRSKLEMWVLDLERSSMSLLSSAGEHYAPTWSVDGTSILAQRVAPDGTSAIARWSANGSGGDPTLLPKTAGKNVWINPLQELPDGSGLLVQTIVDDVTSKPDIALYTYASASITPVRSRPAGEANGRLSPDGTLLAYASDESGRSEVYLGPLGANGPNVQVSAQGGNFLRFSRDGKRLFFVDSNGVLMTAGVETRGTVPSVTAPTKLIDCKSLNLTATTGRDGFDILPDGAFVMIEKPAWEKQPPVIHVILNWTEELRGTSSNASR